MSRPTARISPPGLVRGSRAPRCANCQLLVYACICPYTPRLHTQAEFWILIHPEESRKPTNTARLIGASMPQTRFFVWQRTVPPPGFLALLDDSRYHPYLVFPYGDPGLFARLPDQGRHTTRVPAFVLLDGSWEQARRMFQRSAYLRGLPHLSLLPHAPSAYRLRRQHCAGHLSTVEAAIMLLAQVEGAEASRILTAYFQLFTESALAARYGHPLKRPLPAMQALLAYTSQSEVSG